jgi:apolipoprotein N-acyltransferase
MGGPLNQPSEGKTRKPGTSRVAATIGVWGVAAGLASLVWLGTREPYIGLPPTHPINLALLGLCAVIGFGFTLAIWWERPKT